MSASDIDQGVQTPQSANILRYDSALDMIVDGFQINRFPLNSFGLLHILSSYKEIFQYRKGSDFWLWLVKNKPELLNDGAPYSAALELYTDAPIAGSEVAVMSEAEANKVKRDICVKLYQDMKSRRPAVKHATIATTSYIYALTTLDDVKRAEEVFLEQDFTNYATHPEYRRKILMYLIWNKYDSEIATKYLKYATKERYVLAIGVLEKYVINAYELGVNEDEIFANAKDYMTLNNRWNTREGTIVLIEFFKGFFKRFSELTDDAVIHLRKFLDDVFDYTPHASVYNEILSKISRVWQDPDLVEAFYEGALASGMKPTSVTYRILIKHYGLLPSAEKVRQTWMQLLEYQAQYTDFSIDVWRKNLFHLLTATRVTRDWEFYELQYANLYNACPEADRERLVALRSDVYSLKSETGNLSDLFSNGKSILMVEAQDAISSEVSTLLASEEKTADDTASQENPTAEKTAEEEPTDPSTQN